MIKKGLTKALIYYIIKIQKGNKRKKVKHENNSNRNNKTF